ncbi:uncharacterized protein LOC103695830 isoform X2 [Phoenix dactylifera]|uniref:Uncharacterized protein LOC103695830 isoform X2 n=1 Tax=Phoenix dactylifera TaxID=42345 RepID=A0A8B9AER1_PHODC|nr:uncharacterized protein LOC103695830 isoform X2 [Phoenix dactylifera]
MGRLRAKGDYESLRHARILENKARLESLGLNRSARELQTIISQSIKGSTALKRTRKAQNLEATPLRRSDRLKGKSGTPNVSSPQADGEGAISNPVRRRLFTSRCGSKGRGSIHDPVLGICCHFCRQKKLCGEEDCKRCGDGDINQPCIGKTECSVCHSSNGVLCRACLKVRYGEEMEEVRMKKDWMCPHCIEEKGINPYWICNSSLCLTKRKMVPTGIAIYQARKQGYKSVAHFLMDKLKCKGKLKANDDDDDDDFNGH